jgi:hypothetical protein
MFFLAVSLVEVFTKILPKTNAGGNSAKRYFEKFISPRSYFSPGIAERDEELLDFF